MTRKVCIVVTARPSYSRIRSTMLRLREMPGVELQVVLAASSLLDVYGNVAEFIQKDGFEVNARVYSVVDGQSRLTSAKTTGLGLIELATVFDNLKPDLVVTIADRFETMSTAVAAAYMHIPLAHIQGGEITGSIDEKVRHSITKLADTHYVSTDQARSYVIRMGESPECVFKTGCPSIDIAAEVLQAPELSVDIFEKYGGVGHILDISSGYIVLMQHPVTNEAPAARQQMDASLEAVRRLGLPVLCFWPNLDAGSDGISRAIRILRERGHDENFHFFKNMAGNDFLRLLLRSKGIVGNSSVAIRECSFLGVPAVNIGTRQEGREHAPNLLHAGYDADEIATAVSKQLKHGHYESSHLYGDGLAGPRIAKLLSEVPLETAKKLTY
ncbi:UDP-N-acetylglucosamine 2-epimerase [Prosthecobacter sp.]|uniref:UDP-N-acetylglucosamine 2-epimerase n=1 Tax=Prosthecobacter sp. TaxID=1965333 RepID=UPI002ABB4CA4|nr:UDP-N-acetylglucosamine 2-epimerase [Prosthecobacter sp.]MDZ4405787.1 UDP-N-acetylglucosamine 2-epimerase [Prosthecobacter sp.]